jgi:hypothetical protein
VLVLVASKPDTVLASKLLVSKPDTVLATEAGARGAREAREVTSTGAEAPVEVKEAVEEAPADSTLSLEMQACMLEDAEEVGGGGLDPLTLEAPGAAGRILEDMEAGVATEARVAGPGEVTTGMLADTSL